MLSMADRLGGASVPGGQGATGKRTLSGVAAAEDVTIEGAERAEGTASERNTLLEVHFTLRTDCESDLGGLIGVR